MNLVSNFISFFFQKLYILMHVELFQVVNHYSKTASLSALILDLFY